MWAEREEGRGVGRVVSTGVLGGPREDFVFCLGVWAVRGVKQEGWVQMNVSETLSAGNQPA